MSERKMHTFPERFGFEPDLRACEGRTIERVEMLRMEFGCTWDSAFAVRFTDGTRAFFAGHVGTGIMNPALDGETYGRSRTVETSEIFTKREYAEMLLAKQAADERRVREHEASERRKYEALAAKYGQP
jgi:hypothetical protein